MAGDIALSIHLKLMTDISDLMDPNSTEYDNFIVHMRNYVPRGLLAEKKSLLDKLQAMETKGALGVGEYESIKEVAKGSGNIDVYELIMKAEKSINSYRCQYVGDKDADTSERSKRKPEDMGVAENPRKKRLRGDECVASTSGNMPGTNIYQGQTIASTSGNMPGTNIDQGQNKLTGVYLGLQGDDCVASTSGNMPRTNTDQGQNKLTDFQKDLIEFYKDDHLTVPINPLKPSETADIADLYVEPCIRQVDPHNKSLKSKKIIKSYEDVFKKDAQLYKKIYITGDAGLGKSTLCQHLVATWCRANSEPTEPITKNEETMQKFDFVFYITLRDVSGSHNHVEEMIKDRLLRRLDESYSSILSKVLQTEQCLIILDGLDEWTPKTESESSSCCAKGIPDRTVRRNCSIITATRPWKLEHLRLKTSEIDQQIELTGLDEWSSRQLIENAVTVLNRKYGTNRSADDFNKKLYASNVLDLSPIPVILKQLLCLWHAGKPFGNSICSIYSGMINLLFQLAEDKNLKGNQQYSKMKEDYASSELQFPKCLNGNKNCEELKPFVYALAKLSFETLFTHSKEDSLVFEHSTAEMNGMSKLQLDISSEIGILSQSKILIDCSTESKKISFIHKTFQEFLAGMYVSMNEETIRTITNICNSVEKMLEMKEVLVFISGMNPETAGKLSECICEMASRDGLIEHRKTLLDVPEYEYRDLRKVQDTMISCVRESTNNGHQTKFRIEDIIIDNTNRTVLEIIYGDAKQDTQHLANLIRSNSSNIRSLYIYDKPACRLTEAIIQVNSLQKLSIGRDFDTSDYQELDTSSDEDLDTSIDQDLDTSIDQDLDTNIDQDLDTSIDQDLDTSIDQDLDTSIDQDLGTTIDQDLGTTIDQDLGTTIDQDLGTTIDQDLGTTNDQDPGTTIDQDLGTTIDQDLGITVDQDFGTNIDQYLGTTIDQDLGTTIDQDLGTTIDQDLGTIIDQDLGTTIDQDLGTTIDQDLDTSPADVYNLVCKSKDTLQCLLLNTANYFEGLSHTLFSSMIQTSSNMVTLKFSHIILSHSQVECVMSFLSHSTHMRQIHLDRIECTECARNACRYQLDLSGHTQLESLFLAGLHMSHNHVECLASFLSRSTHLRQIHLYDIQCTECEDDACRYQLDLSGHTQLEILDLRELYVKRVQVNTTSLVKLTIVCLYTPGAVASVMNSVRNAPKLQQITLRGGVIKLLFFGLNDSWYIADPRDVDTLVAVIPTLVQLKEIRLRCIDFGDRELRLPHSMDIEHVTLRVVKMTSKSFHRIHNIQRK